MEYLFTSAPFIPRVVIADLGWLVMVLWAREWAITEKRRFTTGLLTTMAGYIVLEIVMHLPAEEAVAVFTGGF